MATIHDITGAEPLSLGNVSPELEAQFQHALDQIRDAFQDETWFLEAGMRKAEVTIRLKFSHDLEKRQTSIGSSLSTKLPAYRSTERPAELRPGSTQFKVEGYGLDDQADLFRSGE